MDNFLQGVSSAWSIIEPLMWLVGVISAAIYWLRVKHAKRKKYANKGGSDFVIALQVGRPVSEAVKAHFGELDCLIDVEAVLGKSVLEFDKDYKTLAGELYRAMAANQNCPIKLVLSGPVGLSFLIGQLVGLAKFDVEVHQFDPVSKGYQALPEPDRSWL
jgi:hypothetical protein